MGGPHRKEPTRMFFSSQTPPAALWPLLLKGALRCPKPPASCPVSSVTTFVGGLLLCSSLSPRAARILSCFKAGVLLTVWESEGSGSCPSPTTSELWSPCLSGLCQLSSKGGSDAHLLLDGYKAVMYVEEVKAPQHCAPQRCESWVWIRFGSPSVWPSAWSWQ